MLKMISLFATSYAGQIDGEVDNDFSGDSFL
jgi:hypothetical protein